MTDVFIPGIPSMFRVVPTVPNYAVSELGEIFNLSSSSLVSPWEDSDGENKIIVYVVDPDTEKTRRTAIKVSDMVKSAFPQPATDETAHGGNNHESSPSCGMCYLGFEATPEFTRQMIWFMALKLADEVDATASQLIDEVREEVEAYNAKEASARVEL